MNKIAIAVIVSSIVIVGGLAAFSIYLQQDKALVEFSRATNPNYQCLEKWDYIQQTNIADPNAKYTDEFQKVNRELRDADCLDTFRTWMPESHEHWSSMIGRENNLKENCELYLKGELVLKEHEKPVWEEKGCEDFLKQFD